MTCAIGSACPQTIEIWLRWLFGSARATSAYLPLLTEADCAGGVYSETRVSTLRLETMPHPDKQPKHAADPEWPEAVRQVGCNVECGVFELLEQ